MKKLCILIPLSLLISLFSQAQSSSQLVRLNNVADNNAMNAISSPLQGNLVYVNSVNDIYYFDGLSWNLLAGGSGSATDTNDDAWGVTGEDIASDISRTGKVTIGPSGNTSVKLDINGQAIIRNLPDDNYGRGVLHAPNGELHSDRYTSQFHTAGFLPTGGWINMNYVENGVVVTGYYSFYYGCSSGHFEFRYQAGQSPLYVLEYNNGGASFSYNGSTGNYQVNGGTCPYMFYFRISNNMLQVSQPTFGGVTLDLRIKAY